MIGSQLGESTWSFKPITIEESVIFMIYNESGTQIYSQVCNGKQYYQEKTAQTLCISIHSYQPSSYPYLPHGVRMFASFGRRTIHQFDLVGMLNNPIHPNATYME